ncbi:helix-turn-helix domain-containing protein [Methylomonas sp. 2BW1-5-20]
MRHLRVTFNEDLTRETLQSCANHPEQVAKYAGLSRAAFWRKLKKCGL